MNVVYANILVNILLDSYFKEQKCLIIFTDSSNFDYKGNYGNISRVILKVEGEIKPDKVFKNFGCQGIIINTKSPTQTFVDFESKIHHYYKERFSTRKYLIIPHENHQEIATELFRQREIDFVSDILVIESDQNDTFVLKTHKYTGKYDSKKAVVLDKWFGGNESFLFSNNLYPDKVFNQYGREFRMGTLTYKPYSVVGDALVDFHGSEFSIALQYALYHNMTPVTVVNRGEYWGDLFENWTGSGMYGNLLTDKADIGFAGVALWDYHYMFFDMTMPTVRCGVTGLVPLPKLASRWLIPLYTYNIEMWIGVGLIFVFNVVVLAIVVYSYQNFDRIETCFIKILEKSLFQITKIFLTQGLNEKKELPAKSAGKILMIVLFLFSVFVVSTYSSGLSSIMTIPRYEKPIDSVDDINSHNLKWGAVADDWILSIKQATEPKMLKVVSLFTVHSEEKLRELSKTDHFGFGMERLPRQDFAIQSYVQEDVIENYRVMKEDIYWTYGTMMMRKNSILLPSLNKFILNAFQADLISIWQHNATVLTMNPKVQNALRYNDYRANSGVVKLKWVHVEGAFGILLFGYSLGFITFLGEVLYRRFSSAKPFNSVLQKNKVRYRMA